MYFNLFKKHDVIEGIWGQGKIQIWNPCALAGDCDNKSILISIKQVKENIFYLVIPQTQIYISGNTPVPSSGDFFFLNKRKYDA